MNVSDPVGYTITVPVPSGVFFGPSLTPPADFSEPVRLSAGSRLWHAFYCLWFDADRAGRRCRAAVWGWVADRLVRFAGGRAEDVRVQVAREHDALVLGYKALAYRYGGTTPDQYTEPEDVQGCEAMHVAAKVLGRI